MNPLVTLQRKIGVAPDGDFGPKTLRAAASYFKLNNERAAHFFGQCSHETGNFTRFEENLNYSAEALIRVFKNYFPTIHSTQGYAGNPEKIANKVYANRMGNGPESSGDGWRFRGRGAIQLTGRTNYQVFAASRSKELIYPYMVADELAFESALFFFERLWPLCDKGVSDKEIEDITRKINGGLNGLEDRRLKTNLYYRRLQNGI